MGTDFFPMPDIMKIKCPKCGEYFEPSEAYRHQVSEEIRAVEKSKHDEELANVRELTAKQVTQKLAEESKLLVQSAQKDAAEEKERNKRLLKQLEALTDELRVQRRKNEETALELKKKFADDESRVRDEVRKKTLEEHELKDLEKDKLIADYKKKAEELQAKIQQGSQQGQGEVMELAIEEELKRTYTDDVISEVKKGARGADITQRVIDKRGNESGIILWESKNAQWQSDWPTKLKEDQSRANADIAVLVVENYPKPLDTYTFEERIFICKRKYVVPLALTLRYGLIIKSFEKVKNIGKDEKKDALYAYITSNEFMQRMQVINESYDALLAEMELERRTFETKWARQEKILRKMIDHSNVMYGAIQGVVGEKLPEYKAHTLPASDDSGTLPLGEEILH